MSLPAVLKFIVQTPVMAVADLGTKFVFPS